MEKSKQTFQNEIRPEIKKYRLSVVAVNAEHSMNNTNRRTTI